MIRQRREGLVREEGTAVHRFSGLRHELGATEVRRFLSYLVEDRHLSAATQQVELRPLPDRRMQLTDVLLAGGLNLEEPIDFCYQSSRRERFLQQGRWKLGVLLTEGGNKEQSGARRGG